MAIFDGCHLHIVHIVTFLSQPAAQPAAQFNFITDFVILLILISSSLPATRLLFNSKSHLSNQTSLKRPEKNVEKTHA
jgi:hypothetical protein